jgi:hypothetical protein
VFAMSKARDWFLKEVLQHLKNSNNSKLDEFNIEGPDKRIKWVNQPPKYWPRADIWFESEERIAIVEIDNDSDPGRSLVKYWPIIDEHFKNPVAKEVIFIEVWKGGTTVSRGYVELFKFMKIQFTKHYSSLKIQFIDREKENSDQIAKQIISLL